MKKYILVLLMLVSPLMGQENKKQDSQDTVTFGLTTSIVGASYFKEKGGLLSQTSLEGYGGSSTYKGYLYTVVQVVTPIIEPLPKNIFSGISVNIGIGYGHWVYKKLNENKKGWLIGLNIAFLSGIYNQYVADQEYSNLNGWLFGLGLTVNMRAIYQLNRNFGFIIGADLSYYIPSISVSLDPVHGFTGGITVGIAF